MAVTDKYSIKDLKHEFPTDDACLDFMFTTLHSKECSCGGVYKRLEGRKQYQCSKCRFQIAPMAGTIFEKTTTPLTSWYHAIFVFSNAKSGVSSKEMERQLGVTYKTAWRILNLIRKCLNQKGNKLKGDVEMDETYFGGRKRAGKNGINKSESIKAKSVIMGAVERGNELKAFVTKDMTVDTTWKFVRENIEKEGTKLLTDESGRYKSSTYGFERQTVNHSEHEFVRGNVHTNHIESFWSHLKRSMNGTHKVISKKHLQSYVDAFVWHYNNRRNDRQRFATLLEALIG